MGGSLQPAQGQLGMKLRRTRLKLGMTQLEVAQAIGLNQTTVSAVERGQGERESRKVVMKWLDDPQIWIDKLGIMLLEAAAVAPEFAVRKAMVKTWLELYGGENHANE